MESIQINGHVDNQHRLIANVPLAVPPGPVTVWISSKPNEDDTGVEWANGISLEWSDELADARQDIYTLEDGAPLDSA
ncbi:MAG: hypothetical protein AB7G28_19780 [Pirellulales bacterium]